MTAINDNCEANHWGHDMTYPPGACIGFWSGDKKCGISCKGGGGCGGAWFGPVVKRSLWFVGGVPLVSSWVGGGGGTADENSDTESSRPIASAEHVCLSTQNVERVQMIYGGAGFPLACIEDQWDSPVLLLHCRVVRHVAQSVRGFTASHGLPRGSGQALRNVCTCAVVRPMRRMPLLSPRVPGGYVFSAERTCFCRPSGRRVGHAGPRVCPCVSCCFVPWPPRGRRRSRVCGTAMRVSATAMQYPHPFVSARTILFPGPMWWRIAMCECVTAHAMVVPHWPTPHGVPPVHPRGGLLMHKGFGVQDDAWHAPLRSHPQSLWLLVRCACVRVRGA